MHVDSAGTAEVVVTPHLAEQLFAGEHSGGVGGEKAQQLEFLVGEVQRPALHLRGIVRLIDDHARGVDRAALVFLGAAPQHETDACIHLSGTGRVEQYIVDAPVVGNRRESALGENGKQRHVDAGGVQNRAQRPGGEQVGAGVDEDDLAAGSVDQTGWFRRNLPALVSQEGECWQYLALGRGGQYQQLCHGHLLVRQGNSLQARRPMPASVRCAITFRGKCGTIEPWPC